MSAHPASDPPSMTRTSREAAELREAIREAHQVLKDLRAERRALEQVIAGIRGKADAIVSVRIEQALSAGLAELAETTGRAMDAAVEKVFASFERLEKIFHGTEPDDTRAPLEQLARAHFARRTTVARRRAGDGS